MDGEKLSEVNPRTESRRQNELVGKFKMAASDLVSVRGQVMEYTYIPLNLRIIRNSNKVTFGIIYRKLTHRIT